ncbi:MAG: rhomboid family intramembrane serine protease [Xanthomonadaceae bacterium]|nr:rhomboid family intramembrane serine protease [Xanthomonadaceae bacterium]
MRGQWQGEAMFTLRRPLAPGDPKAERERIRRALAWPLYGIGILVVIQSLQALVGGVLSRLGIMPRDGVGALGILTSPLVHGSWGHLMANVPALWVLAILSLYGFPRATRTAVPLIWLLGGLGVWLFARESFHIGASGLTHGLMFFAVVIGIRRRDAPSIALAIVVLFLYGSMIWGVLPSSPGVSFEAHLFGAVIGALCGWFLYRRDPFPVYRRYDWEDEQNPEDDPREY